MRVLITGSRDGLGLAAAQLLLDQGHSVVVHARNDERAQELRRDLPLAEAVVIGDLMELNQVRSVAEQANSLGKFDAVIHNAAVGSREPARLLTREGLPHVFAVNVLAPYMLTALIERPKRLVYLSSALHRGAGDPRDDMLWASRSWDGLLAYAESKLMIVCLMLHVARQWPDVLSNAMEPGWVPTRMGGPEATGDIDKAHRTQVWLATSQEPEAIVSGEYFFHCKPQIMNPLAQDISLQAELLGLCAELTGLSIPTPLVEG